MLDAEQQPAPWLPRLPRPTPRDLLAGLTVTLIGVPQALAYATIAGVPPAVGLVALAVATIAAAAWVSSPYLQTGPVAITALLAFGGLAGLATPESPDYVALASLLALLVGLVRIAVGAARLGVLAYLMSQPVLAGFTPAAAIVIVVSQLPAMLGVETPGRAPLQVVPALLDVGSWSWEALGVAAATVVTLRVTERLHPLFPAVLAASVVGAVVAAVAGFDVALVGEVPGGLPTPVTSLPLGRLPQLVVPALVIALVGFAEPSAIARKYAQETRERWDADREFVSQGAANIAAGAFGAFPVGGSFSRSAVARTAGAQTAWTGIVTGVAVLAVTPVAGVLALLPRAALAAVIASSVLSLANPAELLGLRRFSRQQLVIGGITFALTLLTAPSIQYGVLVGVVLSIGAHLRRELMIRIPHSVEGGTLHLRPLGVLFFGSAHRLEDEVARVLARNEQVERVEVHMDRLGRVDVTGAMALRSLVDELAGAGIEVEVRNLTPTSRKIVDRVLSEGGREYAAHEATTDRRPLRPGSYEP